MKRGFSLVELLAVIAIIALITLTVFWLFNTGRDRAYLARAEEEFLVFYEALLFYADTYGGYPADTNRDIPSGLEAFLAPGIWPDAAWPGSVFDWDNWSPSALTHNPKEQVYQISVRFCPLGGGIETCNFPNEEWAADFDQQSAVYFCIKGPCRSHSGRPVDHPGYCINCDD